MFHRTHTIHQFARRKTPKFSTGLTAIASNRLITMFGSSLFGLFFPIFLYQMFNDSVLYMLLFFLIGYTAGALAHPIGAKIMTRIGLNASIILGTISYIFFWASFLLVTEDIAKLGGIILAIIFLTIWRILYWVPFHTDFAQFTKKGTRGRVIGSFASLGLLIGVITPLLSGFLISSFGYPVLFIAACAIITTSLFPLLFLPKVKEEYSYGYFETFKVLFEKRHRSMIYTYASEGAENVVGLFIWPIFLFQILKGNYLDVGMLATAIVIASIILQLLVGRWTDKYRRRSILKIGTGLYSLGWIFKVFVTTAFQIFIVATYHSFAMIIMRTPFDAMLYERAADAGHYVDEYTVLREVALNIGRVIMILLLLLTLTFVSLPYTFFLAAISALFLNFIGKKTEWKS
jgi:MFS family permease